MNNHKPHAVYRIFGENGLLLYVGCSFAPLGRLKNHERFKAWAQSIRSVTLTWYPDKKSGLTAEKIAIQTEFPEWNVYDSFTPKRSCSRWHPRFNPNDPATWAQPSETSFTFKGLE